MFTLHSMTSVSAILRAAQTIAVVGFSPKPGRPSHMVGKYLMDAGFTVYPVNPGVDKILGVVSYPDLASIPGPVDIVDIFRRSEDVYPIVEAAIAIQAKVVWMQQGIVNYDAAALAEEAGIKVVMDRCIKVDHANL
ncbi:putative CoA-binding protein [Desulfocapsa sulfexigens DSM 10523]|uniref:Putative CoA-binding protein n=1 Tax=Desulfocapsa sulfexigens (strain DSM 10523 / SB164P1) TaxID=1167006 RepID=M1PLP1_DESSD|nr:CoA-binding protein [Desulfocapsa sulfexigens]AGF77381.1 putative CoA-binding protein [Desulfocapsa sulfexigens DSM 10523]